MKITPLFDRVLLKPESDKFNRTQSGIMLGASASDVPIFATVIAVGNGKIEANENLEMQVNIGEKVLYNKYAGTEILANSETYVIVKQTDILCKIED